MFMWMRMNTHTAAAVFALRLAACAVRTRSLTHEAMSVITTMLTIYAALCVSNGTGSAVQTGAHTITTTACMR